MTVVVGLDVARANAALPACGMGDPQENYVGSRARASH